MDSGISVPASTRAVTEFTLPLLNQSKASVTVGGASLTDSLNSSLCSLSVHTAAQINHNYSVCSAEMPSSVKKNRPHVCLLGRFFVCLFFTGAGGKENG